MFTLIICAVLFLHALHIDGKYTSDYTYYPEAGGWLKSQKVIATWEQAFLQCLTEGAVLASPLTAELRQIMQLNIIAGDPLPYYIGANSKFTPGQYVSIEGVPLANMPTTDMYRILDTEQGECLSLNGYNISVVDCSKRLPYMCYRKDDGKKLTECGTFDKEYRLEKITGSCYKVHEEFRSWVEANSVCISEGGYLAIVNSAEEARFISTKVPDKRIPWTDSWSWEPLYVGLLDWTGNGTWLTNHGDSVDGINVYNGWAAGQPNNCTPVQLCAGIMRASEIDNIWCKDHGGYFICEKDPKNVRYYTETVKEEPTERSKLDDLILLSDLDDLELLWSDLDN